MAGIDASPSKMGYADIQRGIGWTQSGVYTSRMLCTECRRHHGVNGDRCLYCQGMNPPKHGFHRLWVQLRTFLERPVGSLHRMPDLVR